MSLAIAASFRPNDPIHQSPGVRGYGMAVAVAVNMISEKIDDIERRSDEAK